MARVRSDAYRIRLKAGEAIYHPTHARALIAASAGRPLTLLLASNVAKTSSSLC